MALSHIAFAAVAVSGLVLFGIGTPGSRPAVPPALSYARAAAPAPTTVAAAGITLHSVGFDFPISDRVFPGGPEAEAINANCTACHSPGMVLTQPRLSESTWHEEVQKMRAVYKAPIADEAVPSIVAYLARMSQK